MNKKILIGGAILLVLALGGGGAWWILHRPMATATPKPYIRQLNFKSFVLSVQGPHGTPHYLVINMSAVISSPEALPATWPVTHKAMLRASVLSALLLLPDINEAITKPPVRAALKKSVRQAVLKVLHQTDPKATVSDLYITKLLMQ